MKRALGFALAFSLVSGVTNGIAYFASKNAAYLGNAVAGLVAAAAIRGYTAKEGN
jgi:uncharacterized membrane protein (DUF4010 family)